MAQAFVAAVKTEGICFKCGEDIGGMNAHKTLSPSQLLITLRQPAPAAEKVTSGGNTVPLYMIRMVSHWSL